MSSKGRGFILAVSPELLRSSSARFATGVVVVTVLDAAGLPHGMTVNSFTSVSLDPPLVLVSVDQRNAILGHFLTSSFLGISVLAEDQENLSRRFSGTAEDRFEAVDWYVGASGVPLLRGAIAHMECAVTDVHRAGDHSILIGEVRTADFRDGRPLLFYGSEYRSLD